MTPLPATRPAARQQALAEVRLDEVVRRTLALAGPALQARDISVSIEEPKGLPALIADPDGIGQVVSNLVQNSVDYTTDGGEIAVRLTVDGASVRCEIVNTGPDIPPDQLPLIWERLHRVDASRARETGGAGIGLALVRQIVERHRGEVGASSGGGRTVVWFQLPTSGQA